MLSFSFISTNNECGIELPIPLHLLNLLLVTLKLLAHLSQLFALILAALKPTLQHLSHSYL